MAPYPIAPPPEEEALTHPSEEQTETLQPDQVAGAHRDRLAPRLPGRSTMPSDEERGSRASGPPRALFSEALLEMSSMRPGRRTLDFFLSLFLSLFLHALLLSSLVLIPLFFTEAIDLKQFTQTFLVAPPPPSPPPPPASPAIAKVPSAPHRIFTASGKLLAPAAIPQRVAMLKEEPLPPEVELGAGVLGGVPGGVPGGQAGGVIGGIISGASRTYVPVAPSAPTPKAPLRVGGRVKAPRPLFTPEPTYPILAKQARLQGDVLIDAVIDTAGNVVEMQVISGHPLLIPAALEALRKWKYQPTYLNDEPVPVRLLVTIRFQLSLN